MTNDEHDAPLYAHRQVDGLLTKQEVADWLGVSIRTVEREVSDGNIQSVKIRGSRRFEYSDVADYLEAHRGKTGHKGDKPNKSMRSNL